MNKRTGILFPHQLFLKTELFDQVDTIYLVEEFLFFKQYAFHKQKIAFQRASMKAYQNKLEEAGIHTEYISSHNPLSDIRELIPHLKQDKDYNELHFIDPTDEWLNQRIRKSSKACLMKTVKYTSPLFINSPEDLKTFFKRDKKSFFQTSFYKQQRNKLGILLDSAGEPQGGKWSFDAENRKKYPKSKIPPGINYPDSSKEWTEALSYVEQYFPENPGDLSPDPIYPTNHDQAIRWFNQFLEFRFEEFGTYEDAIVSNELILNHSLLSPLLNTGLLNVQEVIRTSTQYIMSHSVPINSAEGFIRQIIGWREFIRGMYECKGNESRTMNFWGFKRSVPGSFYDGTTGIEPVDTTIKKVLKTGYCHHIERLMILGNFMLLCEFDPDDVYRWFMEMFIDAYDWVMVPNVYGMSQFSDGGLFATKPYISGSNYIKKMSNYKDGEWSRIWDALYWRFIYTHMEFFKSNHRTSMILYSLNRMEDEKRMNHLIKAEEFLSQI